jgi:transcription elongation factor Elf1
MFFKLRRQNGLCIICCYLMFCVDFGINSFWTGYVLNQVYLYHLNIVRFTWRLHRQPKHLLDFLLAELGTSGSVDGNNQLIIKGRFQQKQIENVLRRYIKEYVTCHTCRSPDTILQKDTRLFFLQCETCGSRCSVASIKSGFQVTVLLSLVIMKCSNSSVTQNWTSVFITGTIITHG